MKKFLTVLLSALLAFTVFAFVGCTDDEETSEINQYDYFDEYVNLWQYNTENPEAWNFGNMLPMEQNDLNIKDISTHSDYKNYNQILVRRKSTAKPITLTKLSLQIFAEADCEMRFSLKFGGEESARSTVSINAVANEAVELKFENFAEYSWQEGSQIGIYIKLDNTKEVGLIKYGFSGLNLTLRKDA